jgi:hypothetical protein
MSGTKTVTCNTCLNPVGNGRKHTNHCPLNIHAPSQPPGIRHGHDCEKVTHTLEGYLHAANDDSAYTVDGLKYCGRCHVFVGDIT